MVSERVRTVFGVMEQSRPCHTCHGTGKKILKKCTYCHGTGKLSIAQEKEIDIPLGIEDGMSVKIR